MPDGGMLHAEPLAMPEQRAGLEAEPIMAAFRAAGQQNALPAPSFEYLIVAVRDA
jgi:hypothetical protein